MRSVQAALPIRENDDRINALMLLVGLFLWNFRFNFGSVFKIMEIE